MSLASAFDVGLAVVLLAAAGWTVVARAVFAAVVGFVAYGLLLALVWVRLAAPDVALTEAAIGSGVTGVLLIASCTRLRRSEASASAVRPSAWVRFAAAALCTLVAAGLAGVVLLLRDPAPTLAPQAMAHIGATGLGNPVAAVLLAYRAFDTFLEIVVLALALVGVWSLAPDRVWGGYPGVRSSAEREGPLAFIARLLPPLGIVVAAHIFWVGSTAPGGEFPAAAILAAMWILTMIAGLTRRPGDKPVLGAPVADRGTGGVPRDRARRVRHGWRLFRLPGGPRQAADRHDRSADDPVDRGNARHCWSPVHRSRRARQ